MTRSGVYARRNRTLNLFDLYENYPLTSLSPSDLHTYEKVILVGYGIMLVFSFIANLVAITIFSCGRRSRSGLSLFLLNLSVFNIIMTVYCIPFTISSVIFQRWLFPRSFCTTLDTLKRFSVTGVVLTLIAIAIDRYCAVKYPLAMKGYSVQSRNCIALTIIWILSMASSAAWSSARSVPLVQPRLWVNSRSLLVDYFDSLGNMTDLSNSKIIFAKLRFKLINTIQCVPNRHDRTIEIQRAILNFLQTYFVPLFVLAFVYLRIAAMLWRRSVNGHYRKSEAKMHSVSKHDSIKFKRQLQQVRCSAPSLSNDEIQMTYTQ